MDFLKISGTQMWENWIKRTNPCFYIYQRRRAYHIF